MASKKMLKSFVNYILLQSMQLTPKNLWSKRPSAKKIYRKH